MKTRSLERAIEVSRKRYELEITKDWRYPLFFSYLQVSPSYALAEAWAAGSVALSDAQLPADFDKVLATYEAFGPVHRTYFWDWWVRRAQYRFGVSVAAKPKTMKVYGIRQSVEETDLDQIQTSLEDWLTIDRPAYGLPAVALIAVPLHGNKQQLLRDVAALLDHTTKKTKVEVQVTGIQLERNKIRPLTLKTALKVLRARAALPDKRLFVIGNRSGVSLTNVTDEKAARSDRSVSDARRSMEILTSRWLNRAYVLAENAARGRFPCLEPLAKDPNRPEFDYRKLQKRLIEQMSWMEKELARLKSKSKKSRA